MGRPNFFRGFAALAVTCGFIFPSLADSSSPLLAAYYDRQMAIVGTTAYAWRGDAAPRRIHSSAIQVGVGRSDYYVLTAGNKLLRFRNASGSPRALMSNVVHFAAGRTGVLAVKAGGGLWWMERDAENPRHIADNVSVAAVGDSANYYVTQNGGLFVKGLAHRGQYGDGRLTETDTFVRTATGAARVYAHTGHALYLARNGDVMGTGGNIYGPVGRHGLGDKAIRWSRILSGAIAVATGSSHSLAIRADGALMAWGAGYGPDPVRVMTGVSAVAAGSSTTIAVTSDGGLWQWDRGGKPRRLMLP